MKYLVSVVGAALVFTSTAASAGKDIRVKGIWCKVSKGTMLCVKQNGKGYAVAFDRNFVLVTNSKGKRVFLRMQP